MWETNFVKVDNAQGFIDQYKETKHFQELSDIQRSLLICFVFPTIIETSMVPHGILLEIVMTSPPKGFKFSDYTPKEDEMNYDFVFYRNS